MINHKAKKINLLVKLKVKCACKYCLDNNHKMYQ
jgi:hypothetical protein